MSEPYQETQSMTILESLTDDEKKQKHEALLVNVNALQKLKDQFALREKEFKDEKAIHKKEVEYLEGLITEEAQLLKDSKYKKTVDVTAVYNFSESKVEFYYKDKLIDSRIMDDEDLAKANVPMFDDTSKVKRIDFSKKD